MLFGSHNTRGKPYEHYSWEYFSTIRYYLHVWTRMKQTAFSTTSYVPACKYTVEQCYPWVVPLPWRFCTCSGVGWAEILTLAVCSAAVPGSALMLSAPLPTCCCFKFEKAAKSTPSFFSKIKNTVRNQTNELMNESRDWATHSKSYWRLQHQSSSNCGD